MNDSRVRNLASLEPPDSDATGASRAPLPRPLGYVERVMKFAGDLGAFQVSRVVLLRGPVTTELVRAALHCAQLRFPLLRSRCVWHGGNLVFGCCAPVPGPPLHVVPRRSDHDWRLEWKAELHRPIDASRCPWRVVFLEPETRGTSSELVISCHHSISDAISSTALVHQLMCYCREILETGVTPDVVPQPVLPPVELLLGGPPTWQRALCFAVVHLNRLFRRHAGNLFRRARNNNRPVAERESRLLYHDFGLRTSTALFARCQTEKTTVYGALCAAMLITARRYVEYPRGCMTCSSSISLRERCRPPVPQDQFGCFFYWVDTSHRLGTYARFWDVARSCSEAVRKAALISGCPVRTVFSRAKIARVAIQGTLRNAMNNPCLGRTDTIGIANVGRLSLPDRYGPIQIQGIYSATAQHVIGACAAILASTFCDRLLVSFPYVWPLLEDDAAHDLFASFTACIQTACCD